MSKPWTPHDSLTTPPTNLKEAIDWVLRVTGRDGKKNDPAAAAKQKPPQFGCLCFLAKAVKDLLYDARSPESPGPSPERYWDDILLPGEQSIVLPVLQDLGLVNSGSTSAASTTTTSTAYTCAGGTEVIKALIDQLAQGLQKWVGWKKCCTDGKGIGGKCGSCGNTVNPVPCSRPGCECSCDASDGKCGVCREGNDVAKLCTGMCCTSGSCKECKEGFGCCHCAIKPEKCQVYCGYRSAYKKANGIPKITSIGALIPSPDYYWPTISDKSDQVHLLARIFLGSVCLIWSGLSQLGFLTGKSDDRWNKSSLNGIDGDQAGLGSFMAAMGYDLERLNQTGNGNGGEFVHGLLTDNKKGVPWKEFQGGSTSKGSVAEYYSTIYSTAEKAGKAKSTSESICKEYPLLVLHILASGYFRAGSAGAKGIIPAPKAPTSETKKETPSPRKPRTIREILYWLSALPYSQGYKALVERMQDKTDQVNKGGDISLEGTNGDKTDLHKDKITHYLMAACGYCPLVLIGIQGTIATSGTDTTTGQQKAAEKCEQHKEDRNHRCILDDKKTQDAAQGQSDGKLKEGQVCYGGYHLEVSLFGPLHGMYANGLFGFQMDISPAQCLDQLRIYVYHCFYQLYFLRKQCTVGVENGAVLGWKSCRYGFQVSTRKGGNNKWRCEPLETPGVGVPGVGVPGVGVPGAVSPAEKCNCLGKGASQDNAGSGDGSPLQSFLCNGIKGFWCQETVGKGSDTNPYPEILDHMNTKNDFPPGHYEGPPIYCPVPMGWSKDGNDNHFKDLSKTHKQAPLDRATVRSSRRYVPQNITWTHSVAGPSPGNYPAHCTGRTLSYLLEYYCDPEQCQSGTLVVLLRLLACITPTVPRTLGDLFGFYYYIVYIGGNSGGLDGVYEKLGEKLKDARMYMLSGKDAVVNALEKWNGGSDCKHTDGSLRTLYGCSSNSKPDNKCCQYISPLSGQQYGQLSPVMAGTYLSWLVYLIEKFEEGLRELETAFKGVDCRSDGCSTGNTGAGCGGDSGRCTRGTHGNPCNTGSSGSGNQGVCKCDSVVSCTGVLPVLYKYGFGYGNVEKLHTTGGSKKCDAFLTTLNGVLEGNHLRKEGSSGNLHHEINKLIYTTRLPWIFVLTLAWLVAVLYLAFGAIWPLDWTHMRSHCRGWFRKGSLSPWEILMVGKKKGKGILEFFGKEGQDVVGSTTSGYRWVKWLMVIIGTVAVFAGPLVAALVENNDAWKIPLAVLLGIGGGALLVGVMVKAVAT